MIAVCLLGHAQEKTPDDIRDIRAPQSSVQQSQIVLAAAVGVMSLALAGYAAWRRRRRRVIGTTMMPYEIALQQLEQARSQMAPLSGREFASKVSDIVRGYVEAQFRVTATQRTTEEFLQELLLSSGTPLARHRPSLDEFLKQSDLIKFAGGAMTAAALESFFRSAHRLVRETAPAETADASIPAT